MSEIRFEDIFEGNKDKEFSFLDRICAFFYHLKMVLFARDGIERQTYLETFRRYKIWKDGKH